MRTLAPASAGRAPGSHGETTQATILFVDVVGSVELSGSLDPQEWWAIMHNVTGVMSDIVHRAGGWVERFTGDGMKAVFGAIDCDEHAVQGCAAALRLRRTLLRDARSDVAVRMGLHSGEVVTGLVGSGLNLQYTAMGYAAALAKRIESLAQPWSICMSADTAALAGARFDIESLGARAIKGSPRPVQVCELRG